MNEETIHGPKNGKGNTMKEWTDEKSRKWPKPKEMKKLPIIILTVVLCAFLFAPISYAAPIFGKPISPHVASALSTVTPSDFDGAEWTFHWAGPGSPNEIGISWGMKAGPYFVLVKRNGDNYVFIWTAPGESDDPRYIILDVFVQGRWISPMVYEYQGEGKPYLQIWPRE